MKKTNYPSHQKEINRLHRIMGQLKGIEKMIEDKRYCMDILVQTRAVASAVRALEGAILKNHLGHCVLNAFKSDDKKDAAQKIQEIMDLFKKCSIS